MGGDIRHIETKGLFLDFAGRRYCCPVFMNRNHGRGGRAGHRPLRIEQPAARRHHYGGGHRRENAQECGGKSRCAGPLQDAAREIRRDFRFGKGAKHFAHASVLPVTPPGGLVRIQPLPGG
ncbi:MAG: hypothetical protein BWX80_02918 [Candidatus Hydrogenedentes bacterium ADurb.Bin101]|nr:MAG: hypothetical protein BWX80_02918 [Candidatus Hydrogenedentes bacterium ADurb.Bin101]